MPGETRGEKGGQSEDGSIEKEKDVSRDRKRDRDEHRERDIYFNNAIKKRETLRQFTLRPLTST